MQQRQPATTNATDRYTNSGAALSLLLHASIIGVAYVGMPYFKRDIPVDIPPLIVELVPIDEETAAPPPPALEPMSEPTPMMPPEPNLAAEAPSAENMPPPKFEIAREEKPQPKPKPPPPKPNPAKAKSDDVAMLQKLLKDMQKNAPKQQAQAPKTATTSNNIAPNISERATMTELDAIRRHIEACWRIDPGKEGIENLSAQIRVFINPDGSARAEIIDMARYFADSSFRTFANSARNAVLGCGNIPISKEHYNELKEIEMNFSPQGRIN